MVGQGSGGSAGVATSVSRSLHFPPSGAEGAAGERPPALFVEKGDPGCPVLQTCNALACTIRDSPRQALMLAACGAQEAFYGKEITIADREMVESKSDDILAGAAESDVSFLVVGDPFGCHK